MKKMTYTNKNSYVSGDCINQNILEKKKLKVFWFSICIGLGYNQFTHLNKRKFKDEVYLKKNKLSKLCAIHHIWWAIQPSTLLKGFVEHQ